MYNVTSEIGPFWGQLPGFEQKPISKSQEIAKVILGEQAEKDLETCLFDYTGADIKEVEPEPLPSKFAQQPPASPEPPEPLTPSPPPRTTPSPVPAVSRSPSPAVAVEVKQGGKSTARPIAALAGVALFVGLAAFGLLAAAFLFRGNISAIAKIGFSPV